MDQPRTPRDRQAVESMNDRLSKKALASLFGLALVIRVLVLVINLRHPEPHITTPDSASYLRAAESLTAHGGFVDQAGRSVWSRTPGYPAFIAAAFVSGAASPDRPEGVLVIQVLLSSLTVVMAAAAACSMSGSETALAVGVLMALEPSSIAYSNLIMTETLYTLAIMASLLLSQRWQRRIGWRSLLVFGALVGVLPIIRPVGLYLAPLLFLFVLWASPRRPGRVARALAFLAMAALPAAAWSYRNYHELGSATFDRTGPLGEAAFARAVAERAGAPPVMEPFKQPWETYFGEDRGLTPVEAIAIQHRYFRQIVAAHPAAAVVEYLKTAVMMIGVPDSQIHVQLLGREAPLEEGSVTGRLRWLEQLGPLSALLALGMAISVGGLMALPFLTLRARRWEPRRRALLVLLCILVVYHLAVAATIRHQAERYRVPLMPLLAMALVTGITSARERSGDGELPG